MNALHLKFQANFSEFSFLTIENNHIVIEESFFSLYTMAELLMKKPLERIVIKCMSPKLFFELKQAMLSMNDKISLNDYSKDYKRMGWTLPRKLNDSCFSFIESPDLKDNTILYKIIKK